jgi:four helix bundle protein
MPELELQPADFRKQPVWRQAFRLTIDVYRLMGAFPALERWDGLATLMRKTVSSMGAHIAEGCTHGERPEGALFFQMALGSTSELLHHLLVAKELGYISHEQLDKIESELAAVRRMLILHLRELGADTLPEASLSSVMG